MEQGGDVEGLLLGGLLEELPTQSSLSRPPTLSFEGGGKENPSLVRLVVLITVGGGKDGIAFGDMVIRAYSFHLKLVRFTGG